MKMLLVVALLLTMPLLGGCWDIHDIENISYVTAIGCDYVDGQFVTVAQMLDFTSVAKQESGKSNQPAITWTGRGKGSSFNLALNDLYNTSQQRMSWSHVTTIVFTEKALKKGIQSFDDAMMRYREIRFTPWIFATREKLEDVLSTSAFFNLSQLSTILHEPIAIYRQKSWVEPIRFMRLVTDTLEPGRTVILPSLGINEDQWQSNEKPSPKLQIDGAFLIQQGQYKGWLGQSKLRGLRWVTYTAVRSPLTVTKEGKPIAVVSLERPKFIIDAKPESDGANYTIRVSLNGNIVETISKAPEQEIIEQAQMLVKEDIRLTFNQSVAIGADAFELENELYKHHYKEWRRLLEEGKNEPDKQSLTDIEVKIRINHSGMLKE